MADIELVIKINENTYHRFINGFANEDDAVLIEELFKNATPLPKGHGRLIDGDELESCMKIGYCIVRNAPTIIEADTESEEI